MKTISEISRLSGVSVRTLRYYDRIGLMKPSSVSEAGYRLYNDSALERLQQILLYRELQFPLKEIRSILESPDYDRTAALHQQIELLELRRDHLENLVTFARGILLLGVNYLDFSAFDTRKLDEYCERARQQWSHTEAYREFEQRQANRSPEDDARAGADIMLIFSEFGRMMHQAPDAREVQQQVEKLRCFITEHFYNCTPQLLSGLGKMYAGGGEFTENIDRVGGNGTAAFVNRAIEIYCSRQ